MNATVAAPSRPVLRYHGGKWRVAPWIIGHFPAHAVYVEPYGGAASVLMRKSPTACDVYNDLDGEVVNLFEVLRDPAKARELARRLELTPYARVEYVRAHDPSDDPVERARRAVVRSAMGFGSDSLFRQKPSGFRTRQAGTRSPAFEFSGFPQGLAAMTRRLRYVVVENLPALAVVRQYDSPRTLIYLDPPYLRSVRPHLSRKSAAYTHEMSDADHEVLAAALHEIKGMAVVSGYDSPLYRDLFPGWTVARRRVYADKAAPREECLWLSPSVAKNLGGRASLLTFCG